MNDGTEDQVKVSFPASPMFGRVGRVAVAGLALRLGIEISEVERLRLAVDQAVAALSGKGRITLSLSWEPHQLTVNVGNPDSRLDDVTVQAVADDLAEMVDEVEVGASAIDLTLVGGRNGSTI